MPIYAHACPHCGHSQDHLLKMGASLNICPGCGKNGYAKQLSAPAFSLKGTGFYATDFKSKQSSPPEPSQKDSGCSGGCACHSG